MKRIWQSKYLYLSLAGIVIFSYFSVLAKAPPTMGRGSVFPYGVRVVRDDYDRSVYLKRAGWYLERKIPYKEIFSEYPQLSTYYFALPALFTSSLESYILLHSFFMALVFLGLFYVTLKLLEYLHRPPYLSLLLLLPSFLYHSLNRFDVLAVFFVSLSLLLLFRKKIFLSFVILAVAVLVKWYPAILLPFYLLYVKGTAKSFKILFKPILSFFGVLLGVFAFSFVWSGKAIFNPYFWHLNKGIYYQSVLGVLNHLIQLVHSGITPALKKIFLVFEFFPFLLGLLALRHNHKLTPKTLIVLCVLSVLAFNLFSPANAPQFFLGVLALAILVINSRAAVIVIITLDILNYLLYPFAFALLSTKYMYINDIIVVAQTILFFYMAYLLITRHSVASTEQHT
jgi:hypothetical protein